MGELHDHVSMYQKIVVFTFYFLVTQSHGSTSCMHSLSYIVIHLSEVSSMPPLIDAFTISDLMVYTEDS